MMKPGVDNLFFLGLAQPMPTLVNFAEQQTKLLARLLTGSYLPPFKEMEPASQGRGDAPRPVLPLQAPHHTTAPLATVIDLMADIEAGRRTPRAAGRAVGRRAEHSSSNGKDVEYADDHRRAQHQAELLGGEEGVDQPGGGRADGTEGVVDLLLEVVDGVVGPRPARGGRRRGR